MMIFCHLFDLLHTLELDEEDNGIDLVLMEPLHRAKMNIEDAMLILGMEMFLQMETRNQQSCKMSNLLHGPKSSNQILPNRENRNKTTFLALQTYKTELMRFLVMNKYG